jgi:hypothetical protein
MFFVWVLLGILFVLVALLAVPLEWTFKVQLDETHRAGDSHIRWLFGLVNCRTNAKADIEDSERPIKTKKSRGKRNRKKVGAALSVDGFLSRLLTLARRLLAALHIQQLTVQARIGLGDAADTGRLWGIVGPLSALLSLPSATRIYIEPDFYDEVLELESDGCIQVVPLRLVALVLGFLLSRNTVRAFQAIRAGT